MPPAQRARWRGLAKHHAKPRFWSRSPRTPVPAGVAATADDAPAPVAPAEEADELLCDLLIALPDDAWSALAVALPDELAGTAQPLLWRVVGKSPAISEPAPR